MVFNKTRGLSLCLAPPKLCLPNCCFIPTLDQRLMWKLAKVKYYHKTPAQLGWEENKILARQMLEPKVLEKLEAHTRTPWSYQPPALVQNCPLLLAMTGVLKLLLPVQSF